MLQLASHDATFDEESFRLKLKYLRLWNYSLQTRGRRDGSIDLWDGSKEKWKNAPSEFKGSCRWFWKSWFFTPLHVLILRLSIKNCAVGVVSPKSFIILLQFAETFSGRAIHVLLSSESCCCCCCCSGVDPRQCFFSCSQTLSMWNHEATGTMPGFGKSVKFGPNHLIFPQKFISTIPPPWAHHYGKQRISWMPNCHDASNSTSKHQSNWQWLLISQKRYCKQVTRSRFIWVFFFLSCRSACSGHNPMIRLLCESLKKWEQIRWVGARYPALNRCCLGCSRPQ